MQNTGKNAKKSKNTKNTKNAKNEKIEFGLCYSTCIYYYYVLYLQVIIQSKLLKFRVWTKTPQISSSDNKF